MLGEDTLEKGFPKIKEEVWEPQERACLAERWKAAKGKEKNQEPGECRGEGAGRALRHPAGWRVPCFLRSLLRAPAGPPLRAPGIAVRAGCTQLLAREPRRGGRGGGDAGFGNRSSCLETVKYEFPTCLTRASRTSERGSGRGAAALITSERGGGGAGIRALGPSPAGMRGALLNPDARAQSWDHAEKIYS